ncbi:MAG: MFS transporter, partial [Caldimonas sp.]
AFTCYAFVSAALWAHVVPAFAEKGLDSAASIAAIACFGPAQVAGRIAIVAFGRNIGPRPLGIAVLGTLPFAFVLFAWADHFAAVVAFAILFGLANGLTTIVRGIVVPAFYGPREVGRINGAINAIALLVRSAAPLAAAWLLVTLGSYRGVGLALAGVAALATLAFAAARPPRPAGSATVAAVAAPLPHPAKS